MFARVILQIRHLNIWHSTKVTKQDVIMNLICFTVITLLNRLRLNFEEKVQSFKDQSFQNARTHGRMSAQNFLESAQFFFILER